MPVTAWSRRVGSGTTRSSERGHDHRNVASRGRPGQAICPYHYEYGEEEWLLVLSGRPTLRHPEGSDALDPLDIVHFPQEPTGAHLVRNETDETVRVLMFSTRSVPAVAVDPDSGKIGVWTGNEADDMLARRPANVDHWDGEARDGGCPARRGTSRAAVPGFDGDCAGTNVAASCVWLRSPCSRSIRVTRPARSL